MNCECCRASEAIVKDYRPRTDLYESKFKFDYKTPLSCYEAYLVCNECFHASDKEFFRNLAKNKKKDALNTA
jgi:hypothetical protein